MKKTVWFLIGMMLLTSTAFAQKEVVMFCRQGCGFCDKMKPVWNDVKKEMKDVTFTEKDLIKDKELADVYKITSTPSFVIVDGMMKIGQFTGYMKKEDFIEKIKNPPAMQQQAKPDQDKIKAAIYDRLVALRQTQDQIQQLEALLRENQK